MRQRAKHANKQISGNSRTTTSKQEQADDKPVGQRQRLRDILLDVIPSFVLITLLPMAHSAGDEEADADAMSVAEDDCSEAAHTPSPPPSEPAEQREARDKSPRTSATNSVPIRRPFRPGALPTPPWPSAFADEPVQRGRNTRRLLKTAFGPLARKERKSCRTRQKERGLTASRSPDTIGETAAPSKPASSSAGTLFAPRWTYDSCALARFASNAPRAVRR